MSKSIVFVGKGGSGKDYAVSLMKKDGYIYIPSYTTRPPRKGEVDGVNYKFISDLKFHMMMFNDDFAEYNRFEYKSESGESGVWYYGRTIQQMGLSAINDKTVMILTPSGVSNIPKSIRNDLTVVFLDIDESVLKERLMSRKDKSDSWERRLFSDRSDFLGFSDYDVRITDHNFDLNTLKGEIFKDDKTQKGGMLKMWKRMFFCKRK